MHVKSEPVPVRSVFKKPAMVTTGMQTMPSLKVDTTRLKPILPRPEASKAKVSLGIQTSKPGGDVIKQEREVSIPSSYILSPNRDQLQKMQLQGLRLGIEPATLDL